MRCGKAEDAGGLTPAKDDNAVHATFLPPNFTDFYVCRLYSAPLVSLVPTSPLRQIKRRAKQILSELSCASQALCTKTT